MFPGVQKTIFGCWLLSLSYDNTHCVENHYIASSVEYSLTVHMACVFIAVENLTAVFPVPCPLLNMSYVRQTRPVFACVHIADLWTYVTQQMT